jgi:CBS domain-containing protein
MSRFVDFAGPDDSAKALAELMGDLDVGSVPIGTMEEPLGVVTDRDILYRVVAKGLDPATTLARDILSAPLVSCGPDDDLDRAMDLMAVNHVRRLAVRRGDSPLVGWITLSDVSRKLLLDTEAIPKALREVETAA